MWEIKNVILKEFLLPSYFWFDEAFNVSSKIKLTVKIYFQILTRILTRNGIFIIVYAQASLNI